MNYILDIHDSKITELLSRLALRLKAMNDPESLAMVEDVQSLKRAKELLISTNGFALKPGDSIPAIDSNPTAVENLHAAPDPSASGNGHYHPNRSKADVAIDIIQQEGKPLHVKYIQAKLAESNIPVKRNTLTTLLSKDRRRRFIRTGPGTFTIDKAAVAAAIEARFESFRGGISRTLPEGFSLTDAVKEIAAGMEGEFTQPVMVEALRERHADIAELIQPASVSTTLSILLRREYLDITVEGRGPIPRRFKATNKLRSEMAEPKFTHSNNHLMFTS